MKWKLKEKKRQIFQSKSWLTKKKLRKELECKLCKKSVFKEGL